MTTTTGNSAATAPLTLINAVSNATMVIMRTIRRARLCPAWAIRPCPAHARHTGGIEASADDEQRCDEYDRGVAESAQRLGEIEHASEIQRERRAEDHQNDWNAIPDEQHHDRYDDREGDCDMTHAIRRMRIVPNENMMTSQRE